MPYYSCLHDDMTGNKKKTLASSMDGWARSETEKNENRSEIPETLQSFHEVH